MSLSEYETTLKTQLVKFIEVHEELKKQKAAFVEMFRKDPRISRNEEVLSLKQRIQGFNSINEQELSARKTIETIENATNTKIRSIIFCKRFSLDNKDVFFLSSCRRIVKINDMILRNNKRIDIGFCFLEHSEIEQNQILRWTLRIPKFQNGFIGMVIILNE